MRILLLLLALPAAAQTTAPTQANPQYQLTGANYQQEAGAVQQMFYNVGGAVQSLNSTISTLQSNLTSVSSGAATLAGNNTFTGQNTFSGQATFSFSPSSNTAPTANALYGKFLPKTSIIFSATASSVTTFGAVDVTSVTRTGTGAYQINFATPMSGTHYVCSWNCWANDSLCIVTALTTISVSVLVENTSSVAAESSLPSMLMCWDYGNTPQ